MRLDEVIEAIEDYFNNEYCKTRKSFSIERIHRQAEEGAKSKIAGLKLKCEEKAIEIHITFVAYQKSTQETKKKSSKKQSSSSHSDQITTPDVSLRFTLKKGLLLKFYKYILIIE